MRHADAAYVPNEPYIRYAVELRVHLLLELAQNRSKVQREIKARIIRLVEASWKGKWGFGLSMRIMLLRA